MPAQPLWPSTMTAWISATGSQRVSDVVRRVPRLPPSPVVADHDASHSTVTVRGNVSPFSAIAEESRTEPETVKAAPLTAPVKRLDEATAARQPNLRWRPMGGAEMPCPD